MLTEQKKEIIKEIKKNKLTMIWVLLLKDNRRLFKLLLDFFEDL
jgi:hypothetical protein